MHFCCSKAFNFNLQILSIVEAFHQTSLKGAKTRCIHVISYFDNFPIISIFNFRSFLHLSEISIHNRILVGLCYFLMIFKTPGRNNNLRSLSDNTDYQFSMILCTIYRKIRIQEQYVLICQFWENFSWYLSK